MTNALPEPVAAYFEAGRRHDVAAMAAAFAEDALVHDEARDRRGRAEIRAWIEETQERYRPRTEIEGVTTEGDATVVAGKVSGTFPGSPVRLSYRFLVADGLIRRLEIG